MSNIAIILAGGKGDRIGSSTPKQYLKLGDKPVLEYSLDLFEGIDEIDGFVLVVDKSWDTNKQNVDLSKFHKLIKIVEGGDRRQDSVYNGVNAVPEDTEIIVIQDSARPFPPVNSIVKGINEAKEIGGCILAVPAKDTVKEVDQDMRIVNSPKRENVFIAQTPQIFMFSIFKELMEHLKGDEIFTDDAMLFERFGKPVSIVMGDYDNIKITSLSDFLIAEKIFLSRKDYS